MEDDNSPNSTPILLEKPFLKTIRTKIDIHDGSLTIEFDEETIRFNIFEAIRYPSDVHSLCVIDITDSLVQDMNNLHGEDMVGVTIKDHTKKERWHE